MEQTLEQHLHNAEQTVSSVSSGARAELQQFEAHSNARESSLRTSLVTEAQQAHERILGEKEKAIIEQAEARHREAIRPLQGRLEEFSQKLTNWSSIQSSCASGTHDKFPALAQWLVKYRKWQ